MLFLSGCTCTREPPPTGTGGQGGPRAEQTEVCHGSGIVAEGRVARNHQAGYFERRRNRPLTSESRSCWRVNLFQPIQVVVEKQSFVAPGCLVLLPWILRKFNNHSIIFLAQGNGILSVLSFCARCTGRIYCFPNAPYFKMEKNYRFGGINNCNSPS